MEGKQMKKLFLSIILALVSLGIQNADAAYSTTSLTTRGGFINSGISATIANYAYTVSGQHDSTVPDVEANYNDGTGGVGTFIPSGQNGYSVKKTGQHSFCKVINSGGWCQMWEWSATFDAWKNTLLGTCHLGVRVDMKPTGSWTRTQTGDSNTC
jgi:hypothetical protein